MSENRVKLSVTVGEDVYSVLTSETKAKEFRDNWQTANGETIISTSGVVDDMDANPLELHFVKEEITVVQIIEAKGL